MSHEIRSNDSFGEVRSNGQRAWHGLGIEIPAGLGAVDAFKQIGLGWGTELLPVFADRLTPNGVERLEISTHKMHVRSDTGDQLGMVSADYKKFDNEEGARFADTILGEDAAASVETASSLYGGRRVFVLLNLPKSIVAKGDDIVKPYICLSWGHGGFASIQGGATGVRVVCANTIAMADREIGQSGFRFIHTGNVQDKLKSARMLLGFATKQIERMAEQVKALAATQISGAQVKEFMNAAFEAAFPRPDAKDIELFDKWVAKKSETFEEWRQLFVSERNNGMLAIRGTAWAAFNTVTEWHDHGRGRTDEGSDVRVHSNLFGVSREAKSKTLKLALALV
jgi:phage/plasmid-like protein (TIGR03299 family)